jgi:nitroreductase
VLREPAPVSAVVGPEETAGWSDVGVFDAMYTLRATRVYEDRPLPLTTLSQILRAATMACSAGNTQPWEFVVVTERATKQQLKQLLSAAFAQADRERVQTSDQLIDGTGRPVTGHAAVDNIDRVGAIVMVFWNPDRGVRFQGEYEENLDGTLRSVRYMPGGRSSSLYPACQNMMLAAHALGVSSLFTTFFGLVEAGVKELLHVPPRMFLECAVFLGYGAEALGRPRRLPLQRVVHLDDWTQPFEPVGPAVAR